MRKQHIWVLAASAAMLSVVACGSDDNSPGTPVVDSPAEVASPTLSLEALPPDPDGSVRVRLMYDRGADKPGPRVADVVLAVEGPLQFVSHEAGLSISKAKKDLHVQTKADGTIRTVVIGSGNLNRLDRGMIALYRFRKTGTGRAKLQIKAERAIFAPAEANVGLVLEPPLELEVP